MEQQPIRDWFKRNVTLKCGALKKVEDILQSGPEKRRETMQLDQQQLLAAWQAGEITEQELEWATNHWLDNFPLECPPADPEPAVRPSLKALLMDCGLGGYLQD